MSLQGHRWTSERDTSDKRKLHLFEILFIRPANLLLVMVKKISCAKGSGLVCYTYRLHVTLACETSQWRVYIKTRAAFTVGPGPQYFIFCWPNTRSSRPSGRVAPAQWTTKLEDMHKQARTFCWLPQALGQLGASTAVKKSLAGVHMLWQLSWSGCSSVGRGSATKSLVV